MAAPSWRCRPAAAFSWRRRSAGQPSSRSEPAAPARITRRLLVTADGSGGPGGTGESGGTGAAGEPGTGGRWVDVAPGRIVRWAETFVERHGPLTTEPGSTVVVLRGTDGAAAECHPPFPPMTAPRTWPASPTVLAGL